ncbi:hypothetical protein DH2020_012473 [Rehmannia glutinosa]|uniref:BHLH domain-containing protein n=1 Tax=Rehmannia glutinosa TaxID=99300 RepID=A0ABR0X2I7_REHGL
MELTQYNLLEELIMSPNIENNRSPFPNQELFPNSWSFNSFDHQPQDLNFQSTTNPCFLEALTLPDQFSSFYDMDDIPSSSTFPFQEEVYSTKVENTEFGFLDDSVINGLIEDGINGQVDDDDTIRNVKVGLVGEKKSRVKKANGKPSKNLMAERRRRKRLNERLTMLRSIVPKISKMDRTSILGDTIDYTRELLGKIHKLWEEGIDDDNMNHINLIGNYFKDQKPNEILVRNPPKFHVERRNHDTRVEVCCTTKPGLLITMLSTIDALGLDIHQCVISCFNDFSLRASCQEVAEHRSLVSCEDVKQALFRNAGYGGTCL